MLSCFGDISALAGEILGFLPGRNDLAVLLAIIGLVCLALAAKFSGRVPPPF